MPDLASILSATRPLTLSGVPAGFLPSLLADLARDRLLDRLARFEEAGQC